MKKFMMIGLVVFGGVQGIHGMSWLNARIRPVVKPTRQQLGSVTPDFLSSIFNIQSRKITTQAREKDLAAQVRMMQARNSLSELGDKKYSQIFSAGQRSPRSWMPQSPRMKLVETAGQVDPQVLAILAL